MTTGFMVYTNENTVSVEDLLTTAEKGMLLGGLFLANLGAIKTFEAIKRIPLRQVEAVADRLEAMEERGDPVYAKAYAKTKMLGRVAKDLAPGVALAIGSGLLFGTVLDKEIFGIVTPKGGMCSCPNV